MIAPCQRISSLKVSTVIAINAIKGREEISSLSRNSRLMKAPVFKFTRSLSFPLSLPLPFLFLSLSFFLAKFFFIARKSLRPLFITVRVYVVLPAIRTSANFLRPIITSISVFDIASSEDNRVPRSHYGAFN